MNLPKRSPREPSAALALRHSDSPIVSGVPIRSEIKPIRKDKAFAVRTFKGFLYKLERNPEKELHFNTLHLQRNALNNGCMVKVHLGGCFEGANVYFSIRVVVHLFTAIRKQKQTNKRKREENSRHILGIACPDQ